MVERLPPAEPELSDQDILATIARFQAELAAAEAAGQEIEDREKIIVEAIGNPETDEHAISLLTFAADKHTLEAIIPVYAKLADTRKEAGFDTFNVVQFPYGETNLANLAVMYIKAHRYIKDLRVVSAVDLSQISGRGITAVKSSLYIIRDFFHTDVQVCKSREEAIAWVQNQVKHFDP